MKRSFALAGALLTLAGCGSTASPGDPAVSPSKPLWSVAPVIDDVCSHVDQALVAKILGVPSIKGTPLARPAPLQEGPAHSCQFTPVAHVTFWVGLGPVPMAYAIPGAEAAMAEMGGAGAVTTDPGTKVDGVGQLAYYRADDIGPTFVAVQGDGVRWYGVTIDGVDETPDHHVLGHVAQEDLATLAKGCLSGL